MFISYGKKKTRPSLLASNELMEILGRKFLTDLVAVQAVALAMTEPQTAEEAFNFTKASAPKAAVSQLLLYGVN